MGSRGRPLLPSVHKVFLVARLFFHNRIPMELTAKARLLNSLQGRPVDRLPVIIPGGIMAWTLASLVAGDNLGYPDLHTDLDQMIRYCRLLQQRCGVDNYGVPFCMTVEAEDFGAQVDLGCSLTAPHVAEYPAKTLDAVLAIRPSACPRHRVTIAAIRHLAGGDIPVVGNLVGPMSLLSSLIEPVAVYRATAREPRMVAQVLDHLARHQIAFASEQLAAGADLLVVADPGAAGDILGGERFAELVVPPLKKIVDSIKECGKPVVLHICGNVIQLARELATIPWDALSVDSLVSLRKLRPHFPQRALMGNVSTHLLATAAPGRVFRAARKAVEVAAILAPACGPPTTTLIVNVHAMVRAVVGTAAKRQPRTNRLPKT